MKRDIILIAIGTVLSIAAYAFQWQREQDKRMAEMDKIIVKQVQLLKLQTKITEQQIKIQELTKQDKK